MEAVLFPIADFLNACVVDRYVLEDASYMLLVVAITAAIGTVVLYGIMALARSRISFMASLHLCLLAGLASFLAAFVTLVLDYCFYAQEDLLFAFVTLVSVLVPIALLRTHVRLPLGKAITIGLTTLCVSYLGTVLAVFSLYALPGP